ncbi:MAG: ATP-binding protein [Candidatus Eisenbacteria bacterium]
MSEPKQVAAGAGLGPLNDVLPRLIEALSDAVVVLDRRGHVVAANQRFANAFGSAGPAVPGRPCPRVGSCMPGELSDPGTPCVACEIARSKEPRRVLQILPDTTGQRRRWEATLNPVLDDLGEVSLVVEVWRDITDRSQLEAQLAHSERLASLGLLAAGVAHELNNPLASVLAGVESLQRLVDRVTLPGDEDEEAREVLRLLEQETRRCSETTDKLLLLGQQHSSRPVWMDLNRASLDTLALLRFATRKQGIVVSTQLTDGLPPVWGREGALRGTLMNLCLNAVQAMPAGGNLVLRTRATAEHVAYEVEDDGPGISPEHLARIWDPFFTTKPVGQGTGLGLSITQRIVTDHGGDIRVASTPGRGACFTVTLPLRSGGGEIG